ncbi:hypothetical protein D3C73_652150 [compost metagenome]
MGKPRDLDVEIRKLVSDVMSGRLPLDRRIDRDDDLLDRSFADAINECADIEVVGTDTVERRQRAAENVIGGVHRAGALQCPEVGNVFADDKHRVITADIGADGAGIGRIDIAAARADLHLVIGLAHRKR